MGARRRCRPRTAAAACCRWRVFLTKNAPGLRTSPVKRGYWVVKNVLGERIPPPPAVVPELPRDEAKLRPAAARSCWPGIARTRAARAAMRGSIRWGWCSKGYGPIGERRTQDLAGRAVDASATFPRRQRRQRRRGPARLHPRAPAGRFRRQPVPQAAGVRAGPQPDAVRRRHDRRTCARQLAQNGYRFGSLVESIVTSPQFLTKRGRSLASKVNA